MADVCVNLIAIEIMASVLRIESLGEMTMEIMMMIIMVNMHACMDKSTIGRQTNVNAHQV